MWPLIGSCVTDFPLLTILLPVCQRVLQCADLAALNHIDQARSAYRERTLIRAATQISTETVAVVDRNMSVTLPALVTEEQQSSQFGVDAHLTFCTLDGRVIPLAQIRADDMAWR